MHCIPRIPLTPKQALKYADCLVLPRCDFAFSPPRRLGTRKVEALEGNQPGNEFAHLSDEELEARIAKLRATIGEQYGFGRPVTEQECREFSDEEGVEI